ncbi:CDP-glycerol glycerophosphotransferase family protein [Staphylococcus xylosus]|uniref:CDP-glycerol glycerophosphotransferase family protein n=1 Tax=Staphylococcus xylosus TaxID=1288 RepID=UPI003F574C15
MSKKNKIKEISKFVINPVKENRKNLRVQRNAYYINCIRQFVVKEKTILLESYHGVNFTGNSYAMFKKLVEAYPEYKCYVAINNVEDPMIKWINKNYKNKNFEIVEYESKQYLKLLATCKYLVNDTSFMPYFCKRDEQVYLNTWHGTPLKTLGTHIKNAKLNDHKNIQKNLFSTDKLSMPNKFTADKLVDSHDLNGILNAKVNILGNPRVDLTLNSNDSEMRAKYKLQQNKKLVLYAPTWKKSEAETTEQDLQDLITQTEMIQYALGDSYHVYLKSHYFIYKKMVKMSYKRHLIPNWVDTNEILSTIDILITDYSSIFFDFLPLRKPIHFFMPDKEEYEEMRGLYLDIETLPGKVSYNLKELLSNITVNKNDYLEEYRNNIDTYLKSFCSEDNGISSPRTIDFMIDDYKGQKLYKSDKKVIVFYGGGFYNNGITNSIINLSHSFDYNKYEFILIENDKSFQEKIDNMERLNDNVHVITKFSYTNRNVFDTISQNLLYRQGYNSKYLYKDYIRKYFELDYKRVFGNLHPDVMIDYGGYNKMFSALFAFSPVKRKGIFLHNDMLGEYNKKINGKYKHRWNLKVIFSLYDKFDKVISVTDSVNEANKIGLADLVKNKDEKMISISNIINGEEIIKLAEEANNSTNRLEFINDEQKSEYMLYDFNLKSNFKLDISGIQSPNKDDYNFVNVARLSPEKNHDSLIKAFKNVTEIEPKSKLYILGDGPLFKHLERLIKELKLENHVFLLGFIKNPFMFVAKCDCFVLTSNYEGQGMVILEAQTLSKPVIGTNVSGINSILDNTNGLLIENNIESIKDGLVTYLNGNVPQITFDYKTYNLEIMDKFEKQVLDD